MKRGGNRAAAWSGAAFAFLLVAAAACSDGGADPPALVPEVAGGMSEWGFSPRPNEVIALGMPPLRVVRPVTLESLTLEMESGRLDVLAARVSLFACPTCRERPGLVGFRGHAGGVCSDGPWPPKGYGPTYPVAGFEVAPGDRPSLVLYLRPGTPAARSGDIALTYRENGKKRETRITNERIVVAPAAPDKGDTCGDSLWFGGTTDPASGHVGSVRPSVSGTPPATP